MSILVVGVHHRSAPLEVLEDLAVAPIDLPKMLARITDSSEVREAVLLSTCQRIEVYADVSRFHTALEHVLEVVCESGNRTLHDVAPYFSTWYDDGAADHLFSVAAGIDSLVVGESEILAQVKQAAEAAESEGTLGRSLRPLFRHALEAAKRVRSETGISHGAASVASAAVALVREVSSFEGSPVAVVGAGRAATSAAKALMSAGASELVVVNRTATAGQTLAAREGGRWVAFESLASVLREAAVVICSTAATRPILTPGLIASAMAGREGRPLALIDIALPRDVHPDVASIPGVTVVGLDDVRARAAATTDRRHAEVLRGTKIVGEEVERWRLALAMRGVDPAVKALRSQAEAIAATEFERRAGRLSDLSAGELAEVEALVRAVVRKLVHSPTAALRTHAADPDSAALVEAAAILFDLEID